VLRERLRQRFQVCFRAEFRIDAAMIGHIVAVETAPPRPEEGGGVEVREAERMQIGNERQGVCKTKIWGELETVGGDRNPTCGHLDTPLQWFAAVPEERQGARSHFVQFAP
jgi:hypothetical protein